MTPSKTWPDTDLQLVSGPCHVLYHLHGTMGLCHTVPSANMFLHKQHSLLPCSMFNTILTNICNNWNTQCKFLNEASWLELLEFHWIPYEVYLSYYVAWHIRICTFWKIFMVQEIFGQLVQVLYHYWPWWAITNHLLTVRHNHFKPMLHHLHL